MLVTRNERFSLPAFGKITAGYLAGIALLIVLADASRQVWAGLPILIHCALFGLFLYVIVSYLHADARSVNRYFAQGGAEITAALLVATTLSATVVFGLLCREIQMDAGAGFSGGDAGNVLGWIGFGFDNLFEASLLDAPEIYGFTFSRIQPDNFWTRTLVFLFRSTVNLLILNTMLRYLRALHNLRTAERI